ncbi:hypothetical protein DFH09DRAFT_1096511 [Mycena vulgaris]|nr:hypothetical protein DFH09DRAFT_1096511 [Mycena vulgaris]
MNDGGRRGEESSNGKGRLRGVHMECSNFPFRRRVVNLVNEDRIRQIVFTPQVLVQIYVHIFNYLPVIMCGASSTYQCVRIPLDGGTPETAVAARLLGDPAEVEVAHLVPAPTVSLAVDVGSGSGGHEAHESDGQSKDDGFDEVHCASNLHAAPQFDAFAPSQTPNPIEGICTSKVTEDVRPSVTICVFTLHPFFSAYSLQICGAAVSDDYVRENIYLLEELPDIRKSPLGGWYNSGGPIELGLSLKFWKGTELPINGHRTERFDWGKIMDFECSAGKIEISNSGPARLFRLVTSPTLSNTIFSASNSRCGVGFTSLGGSTPPFTIYRRHTALPPASIHGIDSYHELALSPTHAPRHGSRTAVYAREITASPHAGVAQIRVYTARRSPPFPPRPSLPAPAGVQGDAGAGDAGMTSAPASASEEDKALSGEPTASRRRRDRYSMPRGVSPARGVAGDAGAEMKAALVITRHAGCLRRVGLENVEILLTRRVGEDRVSTAGGNDAGC